MNRHSRYGTDSTPEVRSANPVGAGGQAGGGTIDHHQPGSGARVLMVNLPFAGHTNPTLGLAEDLSGQGCEVDYINAPDWQERTETTGARFIPYDHVRHDRSPIGSLREISS